MTIHRVQLTRHRYPNPDCPGDEDVVWETDLYEPPVLGLCDHGLREFFEIPPRVRRVELVASTKPVADAYLVRLCEEFPYSLRVDDKHHASSLDLCHWIRRWVGVRAAWLWLEYDA